MLGKLRYSNVLEQRPYHLKKDSVVLYGSLNIFGGEKNNVGQ